MVTFLRNLLVGCLLLAAPELHAEEAKKPAPQSVPPPAAQPRLHHAPLAVAVAHEDLELEAEIDHPELVRRALLVYQAPSHDKPQELEFARSGSAPYVAVIPGAEVVPKEITYAIELELADGSRKPIFASRQRPHRVSVPEIAADARERVLLARLDGRRSLFAGSGDYVDFGTSRGRVVQADGSIQELALRDRYYRIEGGYTYRPLRTVVEFSLRAGVVRGQSPVPVSDQDQSSAADPFEVGLNYGAPSVRFRLRDFVHLEAEFLTSVTEQGFALGAGGAILIGDPYAEHLTLGVEVIDTFGARLFSRLDVATTRRLIVAPIVEVTNMPHADEFGVRLLCELRLDLGAGFNAALRGGYQARLATAGGPGFGGTLGYAF
jgi:hypothetical protein